MDTPATKNRLSLVIRFVTRGMWETDLKKLPQVQRRAVIFCRRFSVVFSGFFNDNCMLRATALAYTTILSIVPFLAVLFSISKGLGVQDSETFRLLLLNASAGNEKAVDALLQYVNNTNVTTLGVIGVATLLFTVISLMGNIEAAFNTIWNIKHGRTLWRKFTDFFSIVLVAPVLLGVAVSLSVTFQHDSMVQGILSINAVNYLYIQVLRGVPSVVIWFVFFFVYIFIPNTKVKAFSAFSGALVGVILWKSVESVYVSYLLGVNNYNLIYGSFAQFPLFLIWIYISWLIVLFGVEVCYAIQYGSTEEDKMLAGKTSCYEKAVLAVAVMATLVDAYRQKTGGVRVDFLSDKLNVSQLLIGDVLAILEKNGFVAKLEAEEVAYILARPAEVTMVSDIIMTITRHHPQRVMQYKLHGHTNCVDIVQTLYEQIADGADCALSELTLPQCAAG
ncbi:YihY/virulence factor BrkB family protein [Halodesulfovibrio sp.]|jgi:membrane protein|uniref:YihY/virulence factor BrkB family protein n=1 Tax=Halodesulfovibrio sp. TaxID=1912772 RepID=UPI0025E93117|nr:YihY/virulence factor BrkB family protein [Halodesulfovibrio sp.]MCT4628173.1 YihY/virulence factor BrkB family protein [Halodesulfovibrio sp.]